MHQEGTLLNEKTTPISRVTVLVQSVSRDLYLSPEVKLSTTISLSCVCVCKGEKPARQDLAPPCLTLCSQGILASSDCYQILSVSQDSLHRQSGAKGEPTCRQIASFLSVPLFDLQEAWQHFLTCH